jgi:hypothetical protein
MRAVRTCHLSDGVLQPGELARGELLEDKTGYTQVKRANDRIGRSYISEF